MIGRVIIYSGNEYTIVSETDETIGFVDENGEFHVIAKTAAVEKYQGGAGLGWAILAAAVAAVAIL